MGDGAPRASRGRGRLRRALDEVVTQAHAPDVLGAQFSPGNAGTQLAVAMVAMVLLAGCGETPIPLGQAALISPVPPPIPCEAQQLIHHCAVMPKPRPLSSTSPGPSCTHPPGFTGIGCPKPRPKHTEPPAPGCGPPICGNDGPPRR